MSTSDLIGMDACNVVASLQDGTLSPHDLLDALEQRIAQVDPLVNALPTLCLDRARQAADRLLARPRTERGALAGLPLPIKDLTDVAEVRTTYGSLAFADHVPQTSNLLVERIEDQGGIVFAKSNTPEFGAGGQTFNAVFVVTRNPWDTSKSSAGSSGGAAAALASGMAWVAHGSDMGGSLRNPASFCGVVGLRPSIGRVAATPKAQIDGTLSVEGPMARNVRDLALLMDAMAGDHPADPLSLPAVPGQYRQAVQSGWKPARIAYSATLGLTPVDPEVARITRAAAERLAGEGVIVEETHPDLSEAHECFQVLRALSYATSFGRLLPAHRHQFKPDVVWNIEKGLALTVDQIARAEAQRVVLKNRMRAFFAGYDLLLCPTTIVPPFPVDQKHVTHCDGVAFETYIDWLAIVYAATISCCPALSIPCGFTKDGLPVGLQILAAPRSDAQCLAGGRFAEQVLGLGRITPILPRVPVAASPALTTH